MSFYEERLFRLYQPAKTPAEVNQQIADLRDLLISAVQDVCVMKEVLEQHGLMTPETYKGLRMTRMLYDHSSAGACPWVRYSIYPYTLDEPAFLRDVLRATEEEVQQYNQDVAVIQTQT